MTEIMARANLAALIPQYDSKAEEWWAQYGPLLMADELRQSVVLTQYHALTFHIPGGSYTPDFLHILADGTQVQVEVKGSKQQRNYRDARSKLRAAADVFRWLTWYEVRVGARGAFELERIVP
jgi:hypothetical protein